MHDIADAGDPRAWLLPETREGYALLESGRHDDALAAFRRVRARAPARVEKLLAARAGAP